MRPDFVPGMMLVPNGQRTFFTGHMLVIAYKTTNFPGNWRHVEMLLLTKSGELLTVSRELDQMHLMFDQMSTPTMRESSPEDDLTSPVP